MAASLSNASANAAKWAGVAKESVVKFSKTAADKATVLSSKVSEQAKDGTLLNNVQSGVTNLASTMGKFGTKTWSDMQSFWSGKSQQAQNRNAPQHLENHFDISDPVISRVFFIQRNIFIFRVIKSIQAINLNKLQNLMKDFHLVIVILFLNLGSMIHRKINRSHPLSKHCLQKNLRISNR